MPTISFFFFLLIFFSISAALISAQIHHHHHHHRRILHQPFFSSSSFDSLPPTAPPTQSPFLSPQFQPHPPQPQQQQQHQQQQPPKYPFSSQSPPAQNQDPFFPSYPSPPPPPPSTSLATFPANISSLILPRSSSSSKPLSRKLVAVAAAVSLVSLLLIVFVAAVLLYHRSHQRSFLLVDDKTNAPSSDSLRLFPPNIPTSDGGCHKPHHRSTSSEFLYIGTVANPRAPTPQEEEEDAANTSSNNAGTSSATGYQKLGSPELYPLPPLPRYHFRPNAEVGSKTADENEEEEFFSPRGSSGGREGSPRASAASIFQRGMRGVEENFGNRSSNSRAASASYPSSNSASPTRSVTSNSSSSPSHSLPVNLSPRSLRSKSPDSVVDIPPPTRPPPPVPTVPPQSFLTQSPPKSNTSSSPSRGSSDNSPGRISDVSEQNQGSPARDAGDFVAVKLPPPPPPPLPPPGFWETPAPPTQRLSMGMRGPPVLVAPSRPLVFQNPVPVVSPTEQPEGVEFTVETNEETQKPKLKPLHWDKVRASSDRAMVWDQLKSSSFQ